MNKTLQLLASIGLAQLAGILGAFATSSSVQTWYPELTKPWFTPPDWLFGPAWITLYTLMGIAAWLIYRKDRSKKPVRTALWIYAGQLALNAAWSPAFFGLRSPTLGLLVIVPLLAAITATIAAFRRVSRLAAALLVPYLLWVLYATALNFEIWRLN